MTDSFTERERGMKNHRLEEVFAHELMTGDVAWLTGFLEYNVAGPLEQGWTPQGGSAHHGFVILDGDHRYMLADERALVLKEHVL